MTRRLLLDVSSLARWTGPAVGIARVEHALAQAARARPGTVLVFWHAASGAYRRLQPAWIDTVLGWQGAIDVPAAAQSPYSRHALFAALERIRLTRPWAARLAARAQDALLSIRRHGHRLHDGAGRRIAHVPPGMALGDEVRPGAEDVLFSAGADWFHLDHAALDAAKRRDGFRYACLCYDMIPVTHSRFYLPRDVAIFGTHWRRLLPLADLVVVNASCIGADLRAFCAAGAISCPEVAVLPLGFDPPSASAAPLPAPLEPRRYALFVSTLEPRKGHAMLVRIWRRLLAAGVPQANRFHLVFVGRPGWMVDDLLDELAAGVDRLLHLQALDDAALGTLYAQAAFCVYPSAYEGFGLPVIEAAARGKPVLASTGGALPETVAGAYPCLPPDDEPAWEATLAAWIARPPAAAEIPALDWATAANAILDRVSTRPSPG